MNSATARPTEEMNNTLESNDSKITPLHATIAEDELSTAEKFKIMLLDPRSELYKYLYTIALEKTAEKVHDEIESNLHSLQQTNEKKQERAEFIAKIRALIKNEEAQFELDQETLNEINQTTHPLYELIPHELVDQLLEQSKEWHQAEAALKRLDKSDQRLETERRSYANQTAKRLSETALLSLPNNCKFDNGDTTFTLAANSEAIRAITKPGKPLPTNVVLNHLPQNHPVHELFMQAVNKQLDGSSDHESLIQARQSARNQLKLIPRHLSVEMVAMISLVKNALINAHGATALDTLRAAYATDNGQPYGRPANVVKILEDAIKNLLQLDSREDALIRMDDASIRNTVEREYHTAKCTHAKSAVHNTLLEIIQCNLETAEKFEGIRQQLFSTDVESENERRVVFR